MSKPKVLRKYIALAGVLFLFPLFLVFFFGKGMSQHFHSLPYYDPNYPPEYKHQAPVDSIPDHTQFHALPEFELTSHKGMSFNRDSLDGKVWLCAFYSTGSPYSTDATKQLLQVNFKYRNEEDIGLLCLTLDAEHDSPEVLGDYIENVTIRSMHSDKWYFLTGEQSEINSLIRDGFMIHDSTNIATMYLLDNNYHLRGRYNASYGEEIKKAKEDIALLKKEIDATRKK